MGGVGIRADGLSDHVDHPVGGFALGNQGIQRPGGDPHDIAAGLIVGGILHGDTGGMDQRAQQPLGYIV